MLDIIQKATGLMLESTFNPIPSLIG